MTKPLFPVALVGVASAGAFVGLSVPTSQPPTVGAPASAYFRLCHIGGGTNCVVDGDTAWIDGIKVRIADIDAPETHPARCAAEQELGDKATLRLQKWMNAGPFAQSSGTRDEDKYGRKLRVLTRGGQSVGDVLIAEGLARRWDGARHPWC